MGHRSECLLRCSKNTWEVHVHIKLNVTLLKPQVDFVQSFRNLDGKIGDEYAALLFLFNKLYGSYGTWSVFCIEY